MNKNPIGIFDSGSGGLTVLDACRKILPNENFVYVSDAAGRWGSLPESRIEERAHACVDKLIGAKCKAVVAACNTATEVAIGDLRRDYSVPFIGIEPALRPAVRAFPDGEILVLCTPATARQRKFRELLSECACARVTVRPQPTLASDIEKNLHNLENLRYEAEKIMCGEKADAVVLGCTHYVFIRYMFEQIIGGKNRVFDGNDGVARRLKTVLYERDLMKTDGKSGRVQFDTVG